MPHDHEAAANSGADSSVAGADAASSRAEFYKLLEYNKLFPVPMPLVDVIAVSTAIVVGSFAGVEDGRIVDFREGAAHPLYTAVFALDVDEVLKGEASTRLYAEYWRAPVAEIDALAEHLPSGTFVFVLRRPGWDERVQKFVNDGAGVPPGAELHALHIPFGIIAEGAEGLEYPLMVEPAEESFSSSTLAMLTEEISVLVESPASH
jgi:hypothetical protein